MSKYIIQRASDQGNLSPTPPIPGAVLENHSMSLGDGEKCHYSYWVIEGLSIDEIVRKYGNAVVLRNDDDPLTVEIYDDYRE